jgi:hypothetical protein
MQLLRSEKSLLHLSAVQKPKLGLDHTKLVSASRGSLASLKSGR